MPHWLLKSALHRAASLFPNRQAVNRLLQHVSGSLVLTPESFTQKVDEARRHYELFRKHARVDADDFTVLELGTGWYPIIPIGLYLCGSGTIWTYDIEPLVDHEKLRQTLQGYVELADSGRIGMVLPSWQNSRLELLRALLSESGSRSSGEVLERIGIRLCVQDARRSGVEAASIDFITSSGVLMLIPQPELREIYAEFRRLSRAGGVMAHRMNFRDSYSYFDRSICVFNMLRFPSEAWRWLDSAVVPQNRLRVSDHRAMLDASGFQLVEEQSESAPLEELRRVPLAPEFRGYSEDDLRVVESWLIAVPR